MRVYLLIISRVGRWEDQLCVWRGEGANEDIKEMNIDNLVLLMVLMIVMIILIVLVVLMTVLIILIILIALNTLMYMQQVQNISDVRNGRLFLVPCMPERAINKIYK